MHRLLRESTPGAILFAGVFGLVVIRNQAVAPLRAPLSTLAPTLLGYPSQSIEVPERDRKIAGTSSLTLRAYPSSDRPLFTIYVGYYEAQTQGKSIHSPKNCLPGAGWEPVSVGTAVVRPAGSGAPVTVNRYLLSRGASRALVYYWYQGRGRVAWNEYSVKWDLLVDKALAGRSEEALVRIVVPIRGAESAADSTAGSVAEAILPMIDNVLPVPARH